MQTYNKLFNIYTKETTTLLAEAGLNDLSFHRGWRILQQYTSNKVPRYFMSLLEFTETYLADEEMELPEESETLSWNFIPPDQDEFSEDGDEDFEAFHTEEELAEDFEQ
jgi:hypothetical protein